jgi:hypothetical protein
MGEIPNKISDEAIAAVDENCLSWIRKVTGNPLAAVSPLSQERVHEIAQLTWEFAYRAGREDAARAILDVLRQREDAAHETYARRQALGVGDQAAEWAVRSRTWRQARQAAEEAAIARGDGVQPTEEQPDE